MRFVFIFVGIFLHFEHSFAADAEFFIDNWIERSNCPCDVQSLCDPITDTSRKEIFIFSLNDKREIWGAYNWTKITSIVMVGYINPEVMCLAHKNGARALTIASFPTNQLTNSTARTLWLQHQLKIVTDNYLDGINIDYEDEINETMIAQRDGFTSLVQETYLKFKSVNSHYQVTVDVAWSPKCIDSRCYNYTGLANYSDFLFVMAYDEQSQIFGPSCVALPNSGYYDTRQGLQFYKDLNISSDKLVLGVPWYGYTYKCLNTSKGYTCEIPEVPFRGVNCSDAAGKQVDYHSIMPLLINSTRLWDDWSLSPFFQYQKGNDTYQVRYDDPISLQLKYEMAIVNQLRGVGIWNADSVNYTSTDPEIQQQTADMWAALPEY